MQHMLANLGIGSKLSIHQKAGYVHYRTVQDSYQLRIRKLDQVIKWFDVIGSSNPRHQTKYEVWKKFGFLPPRTSIIERKAMLCGQLDPYSWYG